MPLYGALSWNRLHPSHSIHRSLLFPTKITDRRPLAGRLRHPHTLQQPPAPHIIINNNNNTKRMRAFLTTLTTVLLLLALLLAPAEAIWGGKKKNGKETKQQQDKKMAAKDSAELGLQAFQELCEYPVVCACPCMAWRMLMHGMGVLGAGSHGKDSKHSAAPRM